jgi:hypothetical protein
MPNHQKKFHQSEARSKSKLERVSKEDRPTRSSSDDSRHDLLHVLVLGL